MAGDPTSGGPDRKHIGAELIIPVVGVVFAIYYFTTIIHSPWTAQVSAFFIGSILIAVSLIFLSRSMLAILRGRADLGMDRLTDPREVIPRRLGLFGLTIAYIFLVEWGGFTLTTFAFLASAMVLLSKARNLRFILGLSAALAVGGYFLFVYAFEVRFPKGPFELLMAQVL